MRNSLFQLSRRKPWPEESGVTSMKSFTVKFEVILFIISFFVTGCHRSVMRNEYSKGGVWKFFNSTDLYDCFYYAEGMTRSSKNIVRVWVKLEYTERGITESIKVFGKHFENLSYSLQLWEINCEAKKHRILSTHEYSVEGNILNTKAGKSRSSALRLISRESVGESLYKAVCK